MEQLIDFVVTRHWYDELKSGRKTVEYRKLTNFWARRLDFSINAYTIGAGPRAISLVSPSYRLFSEKRKASAVFRPGYVSDPWLVVPILYIDVGPCPYEGWSGWYFRIHLWNKQGKPVYPSSKEVCRG